MARTILLHDDIVAQMSKVLDKTLDKPKDIVTAILQLIKIAEDTKCGKELRVNTPDGPIAARIVEDENYPGIDLCLSNPGNGEPGALMDYTKKDGVRLYVWDKENADDDPVIYQIN